jgi:hypothetical protein
MKVEVVRGLGEEGGLQKVEGGDHQVVQWNRADGSIAQSALMHTRW